jgi:hypothetical protein
MSKVVLASARPLAIAIRSPSGFDADHAAPGPHDNCDVLGEQTSAAAYVENALARPHFEVRDEQLAVFELAITDAIVGLGQRRRSRVPG